MLAFVLLPPTWLIDVPEVRAIMRLVACACVLAIVLWRDDEEIVAESGTGRSPCELDATPENRPIRTERFAPPESSITTDDCAEIPGTCGRTLSPARDRHRDHTNRGALCTKRRPTL